MNYKTTSNIDTPVKNNISKVNEKEEYFLQTYPLKLNKQNLMKNFQRRS